jgi:hypothetical protein
VRDRCIDRVRGELERLVPRDLDPFLIALDHRPLEPILRVKPEATESIAIGDPRLVDRVVVGGNDPAQVPAQNVAHEIRASAIVRGNHGPGDHFPGARRIAVRLVVERPDRAQVDDIAGELVVNALLDIRADFHVLAAANGPELLDPGDLLTEAHAARAVDAARHVGRNQGP